MEKKKTISLCMIVKNEEKFLEACLNSVKDIVDEIIIVDTGSIDGTIDIANKFHAKIINYKWNNNFSEARNISLKEASKEWILLMDADDVLEKKDISKLIEIINNGNQVGYFFNTLSYISENNKLDYVYSSNIRLLRNIGEYEFKGPIHEQITHKFEVTDYSKFSLIDIRVHHYGYLPFINESKNKRQRNISIIKDELSIYPYNPFQNYNMGNEYFAMRDYNEALKYYDIAYDNISSNSSYFSNLIIKRVAAIVELKDYKKAIKYIDEGMKKFPVFTELYFYKALIYKERKMYTLAIKLLNKCVELGESPNELRFINDCGGYKSYCTLGDIYLELKDYEEAVDNYKKAIEKDGRDIRIYNKLVLSASKIYNDNRTVLESVIKLFDINNNENIILLSQMLMKNSIYDYALKYLLLAKERENTDRVIIDIARILMYENKYEQAMELFEKIPNNSLYKDDAVINCIAIKMILENEISLDEIDLIKCSNKSGAMLGLCNIYNNNEFEVITQNSEEILKEIIDILEVFIKTREFNIFERLLPILNYVESKQVLLELAKLYERNGFNQLAKDEVLRSVEKFGRIDGEGVKILYY